MLFSQKNKEFSNKIIVENKNKNFKNVWELKRKITKNINQIETKKKNIKFKTKKVKGLWKIALDKKIKMKKF